MDQAQEEAAALLLWMLEPSGDVEEEWNEWYNLEHVAGLMTVPGFHFGTRLVRERVLAGGAPPKYLAYYGLTDAAVLESDEYRQRRASLAPGMRPRWTQRMLGSIVRAAGGVYQAGWSLPAVAADGADPGYVVLIGRHNTRPEVPPQLAAATRPAGPEREETLGISSFSLLSASPTIAGMRERDRTPEQLLLLTLRTGADLEGLTDSIREFSPEAAAADYTAVYRPIWFGKPN